MYCGICISVFITYLHSFRPIHSVMQFRTVEDEFAILVTIHYHCLLCLCHHQISFFTAVIFILILIKNDQWSSVIGRRITIAITIILIENDHQSLGGSASPPARGCLRCILCRRWASSRCKDWEAICLLRNMNSYAQDKQILSANTNCVHNVQCALHISFTVLSWHVCSRDFWLDHRYFTIQITEKKRNIEQLCCTITSAIKRNFINCSIASLWWWEGVKVNEKHSI